MKYFAKEIGYFVDQKTRSDHGVRKDSKRRG